MKYYSRDPDAAFAGMAGMNLEQIGAYNLIIDLLYSRDGLVPDDDDEISRILHIDPRVWKRVKGELLAMGKIRTTIDGMLDANGVANRRLLAEVRSTSARHAVNVRWTNYRKAKENNEAVIQARNTSIITSNNSEISTALGPAHTTKHQFGDPPDKPKAKPTIPISNELKRLVEQQR
jgi:uncharacterized protein YdaU (DUF1376 family)